MNGVGASRAAMPRRQAAALIAALLLGAGSAAAQTEGERAAGAEREPAGREAAGAPAAASAGDDARPAAAGTPRVADTLDLGTTSITGNQELPKVLYIVPWKRADLGDVAGRPVDTLLDEVLAPVDRQEFERHLRYYTILYGDGGPAAQASGRSEKE